MAKKKRAKKASKVAPNRKPARKRVAVAPQAPGPDFAALRAAGVPEIDVLFRGCGDDGCFEYRANGATIALGRQVESAIEQFLFERFPINEIGVGSVLIAKLDLIQGVCAVLLGDGIEPDRLAELLTILESRGLKQVTGLLRAGVFANCETTPDKEALKEEATSSMNWLLETMRAVAKEGEEFDIVASYDECCLGALMLFIEEGNIVIDVPQRKVTITGTRSGTPATFVAANLKQHTVPFVLP